MANAITRSPKTKSIVFRSRVVYRIRLNIDEFSAMVTPRTWAQIVFLILYPSIGDNYFHYL